VKLGLLVSHRGSGVQAVVEACASRRLAAVPSVAISNNETGVTIHLADDEYDQDRIIAQCRVPVLVGDTVDSLAERVLEREHVFLVETLARIVSGALTLP